MSLEGSIPLPLEPSPPPEADDKRLWIGNIDSRLTEYILLKNVQQFGVIKKFDFLFHKTGPLKGQPRGYCFVTYEKREEAEKALAALNGRNSMGKELVVKWAHTAPSNSLVQKKPEKVTSDSQIEEAKKTKNTFHQIMAIEAKLKTMEDQREKELELYLSSATVTEDHSYKRSHRKYASAPYRIEKRHGLRKR